MNGDYQNEKPKTHKKDGFEEHSDIFQVER